MWGAIDDCDIVLYSSKGTAGLTGWKFSSKGTASPQMAVEPFIHRLNNSDTLAS